MNFFLEQHDDSVVFIPTISATLGRCECCEEVGGVRIELTFLIWTVGIEFYSSNKCH